MDNDSKQLSPAAQAVLDAYHMRADHEGPKCPEVCFIAEALCAAADQVVPHEEVPHEEVPPHEMERLRQRQRTRDDLLAIAAELGVNNG